MSSAPEVGQVLWARKLELQHTSLSVDLALMHVCMHRFPALFQQRTARPYPMATSFHVRELKLRGARAFPDSSRVCSQVDGTPSRREANAWNEITEWLAIKSEYVGSRSDLLLPARPSRIPYTKCKRYRASYRASARLASWLG